MTEKISGTGMTKKEVINFWHGLTPKERKALIVQLLEEQLVSCGLPPKKRKIKTK